MSASIVRRSSFVVRRYFNENIGQPGPQALVAEVVLHERDARRAVAPAQRGHAQQLLARYSHPTLARHHGGDSVAALDQRQRQRMGAPARAAAARREDVGWQQDMELLYAHTSAPSVPNRISRASAS